MWKKTNEKCSQACADFTDFYFFIIPSDKEILEE